MAEENKTGITENEWFIMKVLWESHTPCTSMEIIERLKGIKDVSARTIRVMIGRLVKRGAVDYTLDKNNPKLYHYYAAVTEEECLRAKGKQFKRAYFRDDAGLMFATLIENTRLSREELEELKALLVKKEDSL